MNEQTNIAKAFVAAQKQFAPALKTSTNPHFKSKYADLASCVEAVIDALNSHGIALLQKPHLCESGVTIETVFVHESGEQLSGGVFHTPAQKNDPQGYGSAMTYARRYSLMAACGIAPEDDDGNSASRPRETVKPVSMAKPASAKTRCWEIVAKNVAGLTKEGYKSALVSMSLIDESTDLSAVTEAQWAAIYAQLAEFYK
jgi:hypothetical protein